MALNIVNKSHAISREDHVFICMYAQVRCVRPDIGGQPLSAVLSGIIWRLSYATQWRCVHDLKLSVFVRPFSACFTE